MDVRRGRFVVVGDVVIQSAGGRFEGAALADDLTADRAYLLSLTPAVTRAVFSSSALGALDPTASVPPDAFAWPDLRDAPPSSFARSATAQPTVYIRMSPCRVQVIGGLRLYFPLPVCYQNFGADPNLAQNSLSGANVGAGYIFAGNANAASQVIVNYDSTQHLYTALQQNVSSQHAWIVGSINPLGGKNPTVSAIGAVDSGAMSLRTSAQFHETDVPAPDQTFGSAQYADALVTGGLGHAYASLYYQFGNQSLEQPATLTGLEPPKQSAVRFALTSSDLTIAKGVLIANLRAGAGFVHDPNGLAELGPTLYTTIDYQYAGASLRAPSISIGGRPAGGPAFLFNLGLDAQREWQSLPHVVDQVASTMSLSRRFGPSFTATAAYTIANVADNYGSLQREAYPLYATATDPGYAAFDGFATFHAVSLGAFFTPRADVDLSAILMQHTDFPKAVPGFFTAPAAPALGQNPPNYVLGEPPYELALAARFRINPQLSILLQGTYAFNFGGQTWTGSNFRCCRDAPDGGRARRDVGAPGTARFSPASGRTFAQRPGPGTRTWLPGHDGR